MCDSLLDDMIWCPKHSNFKSSQRVSVSQGHRGSVSSRDGDACHLHRFGVRGRPNKVPMWDEVAKMAAVVSPKELGQEPRRHGFQMGVTFVLPECL